jgi:hypothetical protein
VTDDELTQGLRQAWRRSRGPAPSAAPPAEDPADARRASALVDAIVARVEADLAGEATRPATTQPAKARPETVRTLAQRIATRASLVALPLAAAAALVFVAYPARDGVRASRSASSNASSTSFPTPLLPPYEAVVEMGQFTALRAAPEGASEPSIEAGARFRLLLRPESATTTPVSARVWLVAGTSVTRVEASVEARPKGVLRLDGQLPDGPTTAAEAGSDAPRVLVVIGPTDALPETPPSPTDSSPHRVLSIAVTPKGGASAPVWP